MAWRGRPWCGRGEGECGVGECGAGWATGRAGLPSRTLVRGWVSVVSASGVLARVGLMSVGGGAVSM